jgi:phosphoadenosine phosphosulfate reductase
LAGGVEYDRLLNVMKLRNLMKQEREECQALGLDEKIELAKEVIGRAIDEFGVEKMAVAWTGGKDSTLMLWLVKQVLVERGLGFPRIVFVDEGDVFPEVWEFVKELEEEWGLECEVAHNEDVSEKAGGLGEMIRVKDLNKRNQEEVRKVGFEGGEFAYEPESLVGNHLMKTVALNMWLEDSGVKALLAGVRWDEQEARSEDDFWREIGEPEHVRVAPILHFSEKEVWEVIGKYEIPFVKLYEDGYRSLGAKVTTEKVSDKPAWKQDLEKTKERAGRRQDKEEVMERLRALGYF